MPWRAMALGASALSSLAHSWGFPCLSKLSPTPNCRSLVLSVVLGHRTWLLGCPEIGSITTLSMTFSVCFLLFSFILSLFQILSKTWMCMLLGHPGISLLLCGPCLSLDVPPPGGCGDFQCTCPDWSGSFSVCFLSDSTKIVLQLPSQFVFNFFY